MASTITVADLVVNLRASSADFERAMARAKNSTESFRSKLNRFGTQAIAVGAAVAGAAGAITKLAMAGLDRGDKLAKTADGLGIATEKLQALQHAAALAGVEQDKLHKALTVGLRNIGQAYAQGTGEIVDWVNRLGLDLGTLRSMNGDQLFTNLADAIAKLPGPTDRAAAAAAFFGGRVAPEMLGMLSKGSQQFQDAAKEVNSFGIELSRVDAAKMEEANDAITRTKLALTGVEMQLALGMAPAIKTVSDLMTQWAGDTGGFKSAWKPVADFMIWSLGQIGNSVQGIRLGFAALQVASAGIGVGFAHAANTIVKGLIYVKEYAQRTWDVMASSSSVAWNGLSYIAQWVFSQIKSGMGNLLQDLAVGWRSFGTTLQDSGIAGVSAMGRAFANLSGEAMKIGANLKASAETGLGAAKVASDKAMESFVKAKAAFGAPVNTNTGYVAAWLYGTQETLKLRLEELKKQLEAEPFSETLKAQYQETEAAMQATAEKKASIVDAERQKFLDDLRNREEAEDAYRARSFWGWKELQDKKRNLQMEDINQTIGGFAQLAQVLSKHNKKMFVMWKALAIAEAVGNAALAITKCFAQMGAWGFIPAAGIAAACAAQIATIAATKYDGGGSSSAASSVSVGGGSEPSGGGGGQEQAARQTLIVQGGPMVSVEMLKELFAEAKRRNIVFDEVRMA